MLFGWGERDKEESVFGIVVAVVVVVVIWKKLFL